MASNVSNLLKEKIVTPVANSVAAQVDNKVKNGIILRKFIGVQLGESNTGCQLIKIDLNKINVKDPSYEFTLYIKAFSQKGLFNFIVNVNKTDSLQVDVKCEVKNSDSNNGEVIGYYDVDAVGNTITVSLLKAFVVNTSINECKFVSTKDTLNISDLDIDWSDTGNVKNDTSIDIKGKESIIEIDVDKYLRIDTSTLGENQRYRIATIDYSKLSEAKYFDGTSWSPTIGKSIGCFVRIKIASDLMGMMILEIRPFLMSMFDLRSASVILESKGKLTFSIDSDRGNIDAFLYKAENKSIQIFYNNDLFSTTSKDTIHVFSCEIISLNAKLDPDTIKVTFDMDTTIVTDRLYGIGLENNMNLYKVFTTDVNSIGGPNFNGLVPGPNKNEADNKYLLGADAKWHPRKTENEYIADLKPTEEIKGLSETDTTKGISFVTIDFNTLSQKVVEAAPSTVQEFDINMKVLTHDLGIITISAGISVTTAGLFACSGVLSDRGMGGKSVSFSTSYSGKLGTVVTPGFYVNDMDTKIFKIALYTPIANDGVKIIDAVVTSYSDIIDESDIVFTWELGILEKKPPQLLRSDIIYPRIDLDRELVFDQMNIETPISETDEDTLFAEQIKHNGLVPAPGKYEVNNGYLLGADGNWHPRKIMNDSFVELVPDDAIKGLDIEDITKAVSFVTFDFTNIIAKLTELSKSSTSIPFEMDLRTANSGDYHIDGNFTVNKSGLIPTTAFITPLSKKGVPIGYLENPSEFYGEVIDNPCFYIMDNALKTVTFALYTPFANSSVCIKDFYIYIDESIASLSDLLIEWKLIAIDKPAWAALRVQKFTNGSILPLSREFDQMDIETPIDEADSFVLEKERIKHNGLVPAPGKYEVDNGYYLKADGSWDLPKRQVQDAIATVTPTSDMISQVEASKTTKLISFLTIDVTDVASTIEKTERFTFSMDVLTCDFGLVRILFTIIINTRGFSNISNFSSDLGTNMLPLQLTRIYNLKDYGVETMSPIFGISDATSNKGIFNIGINGASMKQKVIVLNISCIPGQTTLEYKPFKYIFEPTLIDLDSSTTIQRFNSSLIGSMDPSNVFGPITEVTSEEIANETDPYELKMKKLRKNGLVPAPYQYEVDQGRVLCADGSWIPTRGNNNSVSVVTPSEEMTSQVSSTVGITFATFDYSKIIESLSLAVNTGSGFEGVLIINTKLFGEILINFSVTLFNLNGTINKGATAYANVGTKSIGHHSQIASIQNTYGADIKTPVFIYTDSVNNICKIGLYGTASKSPVIIKDCTLNQTYTDFDVNDITITWEPTTITISEENTNDASLFTNMDWSKTFTPMTNMTDPDGSYSENNTRRWKLQNNGLVPAPTKYEADQGCVLYADGTWGPIKGIIRNRTFTVTPHTDSSSTQTNDYVITEGAEDLATAIDENYSVDINIVFSGLGTKNNTNTTLTITGVTGTVNLYDYSGNPIKYITDGMSMKCTIFKNTIDDPVESMNAYCIYDIVSYPDTINGPSE